MIFLTQGKIEKLLNVKMSAAAAYTLSVFVLAITLSIAAMALAIYSGGESKAGLSVLTRIFHLLLLGTLVFVISGFSIVGMSLLPAYVLLRIARKLNIHQVVVYLLMGALVALPFTAVLVDITDGSFYTDPPTPPSSSERLASLRPLFGCCGAFMGLTLWFFCGRHFKVTTQGV